MRTKYLRTAIPALVLAGLFFGASVLHAEEFSSTNFTVQNPTLFSGGFSSSVSFGLQSIISQIAPGTSTSATFGGNAGFLFFPFVSTPAVSSTAGDGQVALSWTASDGFLGWTVSGYSVGQSTASGGPYSYSAVGNVTSSTRTGLTNGTTYYFVIVAKDSFGNFIATSTQASATPASAGGSGGGGGGGGGGSGGGGPVGTQLSSGATVNISGRAYPLSHVTVLKDGQIAIATIAGPDAAFSVSLTGLSTGAYTITVYGEDASGHRSTTFSFPVQVAMSATTNIGGIFLAPTISIDKSEVKRGDNIAIFGQSVPRSDITILVHSDQELFAKTTTDAQGAYLYNLDTTPLDMGGHTTKSKSAVGGEISSFGTVVNFSVGTKNVKAAISRAAEKGDISGDGKVNLIDFSIVAYWYKRPSPPPTADLNGDGKVDLVDFSIMAFHWTG